MKTVNTLLSIDPNYVIIVIIAVCYSLEQILNTPFKFTKRPQHLLHNVMFQAVLLAINFFMQHF